MEIEENLYIDKDENGLIYLMIAPRKFEIGSLNDLKRLVGYVQDFPETASKLLEFKNFDIYFYLEKEVLKMVFQEKEILKTVFQEIYRRTTISLDSSKDEFYLRLRDAFELFGGDYSEITCGQYQETFVVDCYEHLSEHLQKEGITYRMLSKKSGYSIRKIKKCFSEGKYLRDFAALCYHAGLKLKVSIE